MSTGNYNETTAKLYTDNGMMTTNEIYARDVIDFSTAMKAVDPSILIIANGHGEEFFKTVIMEAGDHIDRLCVSNYGVHNFHAGYSTYRDTVQCLIQPALTAIKAMNRYATPDQLEKWKMIVAEYGPIDWFDLWPDINDMGHAIVTFDMTGQLLVHPQVEFSCFWNTRWIENESNPYADHDALDKDGNFYPTGYSLMIWGNFLGKLMVRSGSTPFIRTYASFDPGSGTLFVYLINKRNKPERIKLEPENYTPGPGIRAWEYFGQSPEDLHPVWQEKVIGEGAGIVDLKGLSITMIEMKVNKAG